MCSSFIDVVEIIYTMYRKCIQEKKHLLYRIGIFTAGFLNDWMLYAPLKLSALIWRHMSCNRILIVFLPANALCAAANKKMILITLMHRYKKKKKCHVYIFDAQFHFMPHFLSYFYFNCSIKMKKKKLCGVQINQCAFLTWKKSQNIITGISCTAILK